MATKRRGRPRKLAPGPVLDRYHELEGRGWTGAAIARQLVQDFPTIAPDERTVQRYVRDDRSVDKSGKWRLWMTDPEDVPVVFEALAAAIRTSEGETRWLSSAEAEWIVRIHRSGTTAGGHRLDPFAIYLMARSLARAEARDDNDHVTDLLFATTTDLLPDDVPGMPGPGQSLRDWMDNGPAGVHSGSIR